MYVCPNASSETPASGDGNLLGNLLRMQEEFSQEALCLLARGRAKYFPVFVCDTGFQVSGIFVTLFYFKKLKLDFK